MDGLYARWLYDEALVTTSRKYIVSSRRTETPDLEHTVKPEVQ